MAHKIYILLPPFRRLVEFLFHLQPFALTVPHLHSQFPDIYHKHILIQQILIFLHNLDTLHQPALIYAFPTVPIPENCDIFMY